MSYWILPLGATISVHVDRLEGNYAVLEWPNEALTAIQHEEFPFEIQEGCHLQMHLLPSPIGVFRARYENPSLLNRWGQSLIIPMDNITRAGFSYWIFFERVRCEYQR